VQPFGMPVAKEVDKDSIFLFNITKRGIRRKRMSYPKWLKIIPKKDEDIHINKVKQESIDAGEMASGSPSAATEKLARIIEQRDAVAKILVVGDGLFSQKLSDYAIKMGQRLDCEIVALSIFDKHCRERRDPDESEKNHFIKRSELGAVSFADKAVGAGIKFYQLTKIGEREVIVDQVVKEIAGIRYVLTEPDDRIKEELSGRVQLPAINTPWSKL
jgi:hypothetical protein